MSPVAEERLPVLRPYMLRWSYLRPETVWIFSCRGENLKELKRPKDGFFLSHGWMEYMKNSRLDLNRILAEKGPEATEEYMRTMFRGFENFYIIDTGIYPLEEIEAYIQPLADMIDGRISKVRGDWGILKKMAAGKIDDDFLVAKKGETVKEILQRERHMKSF